MTRAKQGTIQIRWVRSGIAFNRKQAEIVRALGLRRLNHVVERSDNSVVRGLIAKVPHLVQVVEPAKAPGWASVPEYTITSGPQAEKASGREPVSEAEPLPEAVATGPEPVPATTGPVADATEPITTAAEPEPQGKPKRRTRASKTASPEESGDAGASDEQAKD
jgi:large subunit ribosomal protein L30